MSLSSSIMQEPLFSAQSFKDTLKKGTPILLSSSVASSLYERGIFINKSFEEINLSQPDLVRQIYKDFLVAGADILCVNTWAANSCKLKSFALTQKVLEINEAAVKLAQNAVHETTPAWIAGVIGPLGLGLDPWGPISLNQATDYFKEQISCLFNAGVHLFLLEGFTDLLELQQAIKTVHELCDLAIIATMDINEKEYNLFKTEIEWFIKKMDEWGADVVGISGGNASTSMLEIAKNIQTSTKKPVVLLPNAGQTKIVDGRLIYMANPEYMGEFARQAFNQSIAILGGSSGINADHLRLMAAALRQAKAFMHIEFQHLEFVSEKKIIQAEIPKEQQSHWAKKIYDGKFVTCVELLPPKGLDLSKILERSKFCKENNIDAINIPDGPRASARMSSLVTACIIEREMDIETILHYTCRDRNLLGMQGDLLGAAGLGLKNILCVTGDPPKMGSYPNTTAVFDMDAIGLVNMLNHLNLGCDLAGTNIGRSTSSSIGVGVNPVALDINREKSRFQYKVEAGAHWAITQPVFDADSLFRFLEFSSKFNIAIIAGVWPLKSLRNAEFMANEVPGVCIPDQILNRMKKYTTAAEQMEEGILIARELIEQIRSSVQGLQISAPLGQVEFALKII